MENKKTNLSLAYLAGFLTATLIGVIILTSYIIFNTQKTTPNPTISTPATTAPATPKPTHTTSGETGGVLAPTGEADNNLIKAVIGLSETEGTQYLENAGWRVRVTHRNGEDFILTADYSPQRANIYVENDIIVKAEIY